MFTASVMSDQGLGFRIRVARFSKKQGAQPCAWFVDVEAMTGRGAQAPAVSPAAICSKAEPQPSPRT